MRQLATLALAMLSLVFFIGSKCNSGDFTDSYLFCTPGCVDGTGHCFSNNSQCPAGECTTGTQTFLNGANECNTLENDGANNNCGNSTTGIAVDPANLARNILTQRMNWFSSIGCTGAFNETNPAPAPSPSSS